MTPGPNDRYTNPNPVRPDNKPDALARLEAWLAENPTGRLCKMQRFNGRPWFIELHSGEEMAFGAETNEDCGTIMASRVGIAKEPGLAATILAALEKAEELNL